jgi:hypothetical protein
MAARIPTGTGTSDQVAECNRCDDPGLGRPMSVTPMNVIASELPGYDCICEVTEAAICAYAADVAANRESWCYGEGGTAPCPGAWLGFDAIAALQADLYVACLDDNP